MVLALKTPTEVGMLQAEVHQFYFSLSKCVYKVVEGGHLKHIKLINIINMTIQNKNYFS